MSVNDIESKVYKLLQSDISGNEVHKMTGLTKARYYQIKDKESLNNLRFSTMKNLADLYDKKELEKLAIEDSSIEFFKFLELVCAAVTKISLLIRADNEDEKVIYDQLFQDLSKVVMENKTDFIPYFEKLEKLDNKKSKSNVN